MIVYNIEKAKLRLMHEIENNDIHCSRIYAVLPKINHFLPMTPQSVEALSIDDVSRFALLNERFGKLQDSIGGKVFIQLLILLKEPMHDKGFADVLNRLARLKIVESPE